MPDEDRVLEDRFRQYVTVWLESLRGSDRLEALARLYAGDNRALDASETDPLPTRLAQQALRERVDKLSERGLFDTIGRNVIRDLIAATSTPDAAPTPLAGTVRDLESRLELLEEKCQPRGSVCEYARERHQNLARWRNLWTILLFAFAAAVVLFLIGAVLLFIRQSWLPGALSTLGTIANGLGIRRVLDRRREAVQEEEEGYRDVVEKCQDRRPADEVRRKAVLFFGIR